MGQALWTALLAISSGGINPGETAEQAMYRELFEEVGLHRKDVRILASTRNWLRYKLPKRLVRWTQSRYVSARNKSGFFCS